MLDIPALTGISIAALLGLAGYAITRLSRSRRPRIELVQGDITTQRVDAIVNAAKSSLLGGGGVDGAIHLAAGPSVLDECRELRVSPYPDGLPTGQAVRTGAGRLYAHHIIHTVGPVYSPTLDRSAKLRACYTASLAVADKEGAETVAFPLISSGVYGWPVEDAIVQAVSAIRAAKTQVRTVRLVVFDEETHRIAKTHI